MLPKGDNTLFPSFPRDSGSAGGEIHCIMTETRQFTESHPGAVEELEDCRRAFAGRCRAIDGFQRALYRWLVEVARKAFFEFRGGDRPGGVHLDAMKASEVFEKRSDAGKVPGNAFARILPLHQRSQKRTDYPTVHPLHIPRRPPVHARHELIERQQVFSVGDDRVPRVIPILLKVPQKCRHLLVHASPRGIIVTSTVGRLLFLFRHFRLA